MTTEAKQKHEQRTPVDPRFDFKAYCERRKAEAKDGGRRGPGDYAFSVDKQMLAALGTLVPVRMACEAYLRTYKDYVRGELLGSAVRVGPSQFPDLFKLVSACAAKLTIPIPEVFVIQNPVINAFTYGTNEDSFIVVHSATIDHLTEPELLFIIGHECGHIHNEHVTYYSLARDLARIGSLLMAWMMQPVTLSLAAWARRSEVTADRAGLLCCQRPEAAKHALIKAALGSQKLYEQIDVDEFLGQVGKIKKTIGRFAELFQSHPYLPKRVQALELFERSVLYVGEDEEKNFPGKVMTAAEPDQRVADIIKVLG